MRRPDKTMPRAGKPRGTEEIADKGEVSGTHYATHWASVVKRLIVGAALRGLLPARVAQWLINALGLKGA